MPWFKRLRWRLIGSQFLVAFVGVTIMIIATSFIILNPAPHIIRTQLLNLIESPELIDQIESFFLNAFQDAVLLSVAFAAVAAILAGIGSSVVLWRTLISPMRTIAQRSQRIADGRYGERVEVPTNSGQAMAQLVMNFNQMTDNLESIEQKRIALLNNISHELRTPLSGLNGYIEGLMDNLFEPNEETFSWMSDEIKRLSRLVDDLQNLSRIEAGQISLDLQTVDLNPTIERIITQLNPQALSKEINLSFSPAEARIYVLADVDRTTQILINLIGNAIRYTPNNGTILVQSEKKKMQAVVTIQDNGIGIPEEALPYLFERFYRVDQSRARATGGSGIGLAISRHLAWAMGGDISAHSLGKNQGSTFTFSLPLSSDVQPL